MRTLGSAAAVVAAIQEDARSEIDRIAADADRAVAHASGAHDAAAPPDRDARLAAARREASERIARAKWLDMSAALQARERWIADAVAQGRALLLRALASDEGPALLAALAADGIASHRGAACEIVVNARDLLRLDDGWRTELMRRTGCPDIRVVAGPVDGCVVRTADGRASFDNTWQAREQRFAQEWRAALGHLYEGTAQCLDTSPAA